MTTATETTLNSLKKGQKIKVTGKLYGSDEETDEGEVYENDSQRKKLTYYRRSGSYKTLDYAVISDITLIDEYSPSGPLDY